MSLNKEFSASDEVSVNVKHRQSRASRYLLAALMVSIGVNVVLAHRVRSLSYTRSLMIGDHQLMVGASVGPIQANRLGGSKELISYNQSIRPTVLYVFAPTCPWCTRNLENFRVLLDKKRDEYRFIGISLAEEGLDDYVTKNELKLPVYFGLSRETLKAYRLGGTPETIVLSPEGKVLGSWAGAYSGEQKSQVETFFHVNLPGLRSQP